MRPPWTKGSATAASPYGRRAAPRFRSPASPAPSPGWSASGPSTRRRSFVAAGTPARRPPPSARPRAAPAPRRSCSTPTSPTPPAMPCTSAWATARSKTASSCPISRCSRGDAHRVANLRSRPRATVVVRSGWEWASAEGPAELAGPDDPMPGVDAERLRLLLREIFTAAGGEHDDFDAYDRVMADEHRVAVLVRPDRGFARPPG